LHTYLYIHRESERNTKIINHYVILLAYYILKFLFFSIRELEFYMCFCLQLVFLNEWKSKQKIFNKIMFRIRSYSNNKSYSSGIIFKNDCIEINKRSFFALMILYSITGFDVDVDGYINILIYCSVDFRKQRFQKS